MLIERLNSFPIVSCCVQKLKERRHLFDPDHHSTFALYKPLRLPQARRHADDLLVYDNTPNGRGHRLVARFIAGELVKVTHSSPDWLKDVSVATCAPRRSSKKSPGEGGADARRPSVEQPLGESFS
jgi:hypothetical protein